MRETRQAAETVDEAIEQALGVLDAARDEIEFEVLVEPEHRVFGKNIDAEVRVWVVEEQMTISIDEDGQNDAADDDQEVVEAEADLDDSVVCDEEMQSFSREPGELSEDELDQVADTAIDVLREILAYFGAEDSAIDEYEGDKGEIQLDVVGDDLAVLIGRHGRTLDALQYAVVSATNRRLGYRYPVVIDVEGYKYRRRQKIEGLARSAATKACKQGKNVRLRPMTSYERRIVHLALRDDSRVTTASEGEEPNRRVVVKPV